MKILIAILGCLIAGYVQGSILAPWKYIKQYQLGIDVGDIDDRATFSFDIEPGIFSDERFCESSERNLGLNKCDLVFQKKSSNYGIYLEQPFKRSGFWHLDWDVSFALRTFSGEFAVEEGVEPNELPIKDVLLDYYGITARLYVTFGITPKKWPEVLVSIGPTGEIFGGRASFNGKSFPNQFTIRRSRVLGIPYYSVDIVFWRFGKGYFGFTGWIHEGKDDVQEGRLLPQDEKPFTDFNVTMSRSFIGLKLLLK